MSLPISSHYEALIEVGLRLKAQGLLAASHAEREAGAALSEEYQISLFIPNCYLRTLFKDSCVTPGLAPGIQPSQRWLLDGRVKPGHDVSKAYEQPAVNLVGLEMHRIAGLVLDPNLDARRLGEVIENLRGLALGKLGAIKIDADCNVAIGGACERLHDWPVRQDIGRHVDFVLGGID